MDLILTQKIDARIADVGKTAVSDEEQTATVVPHPLACLGLLGHDGTLRRWLTESRVLVRRGFPSVPAQNQPGRAVVQSHRRCHGRSCRRHGRQSATPLRPPRVLPCHRPQQTKTGADRRGSCLRCDRADVQCPSLRRTLISNRLLVRSGTMVCSSVVSALNVVSEGRQSSSLCAGRYPVLPAARAFRIGPGCWSYHGFPLFKRRILWKKRNSAGSMLHGPCPEPAAR